jgi:ATP-dependent DNA helicase RecQ
MTANSSSGLLQAINFTVFGDRKFRDGQEKAIQHIVSNTEDLIFVAHTGFGKSRVYQVAALCLQGTSIIVAPLLSLMRDQLDGLLQRQVACVMYHSGLSPKDRIVMLDVIQRGVVKMVFISPELLLDANDGIRSCLSHLHTKKRLSAFIIDEAHVVAEWGGNAFRTSYLDLHTLRKIFTNVKFVAFTATATTQTLKQIASALGMKNAKPMLNSCFRHNLHISVVGKVDDDPATQLLALIKKHPSDMYGIVYTVTRQESAKVAKYLSEQGLSASCYHGGLDQATQIHAQKHWMSGESKIMVATAAFGMGVDKSNIRYVILYSIPTSIESMFQQLGRAGRDGRPASCTIMFSLQDKMALAQSLCKTKSQREMLIKLVNFCTDTKSCRHKEILSYFNDNARVNIKRPCAKCDNCDKLDKESGAASMNAPTTSTHNNARRIYR